MDNIINKDDYPSNSKTTKKKQVKQVAQGKVKTKKPGLCKRLIGTFFSDDLSSVASYVVYDVVIPEAKRTLHEIITGGSDILLFGEKTPSSKSRRRSKGSYVSYNSYYDEPKRKSRVKQARTGAPWHSYDEIFFEHRGEAVDALQAMLDVISEYDIISVGDFYEIVGLRGNSADRNYGWEDLSTASIQHVRGEGYRIKLPKARVI